MSNYSSKTIPFSLLLLILLSGLSAGCADGTPTPAPLPTVPAHGRPRPSPSAMAPGARTNTPGPPPSVLLVPSSTTVATSTAPGWTRYDSINQVRDLAFAPDGTLWALTRGGVVHWDLSSDLYTRHLLDASHLAVAPDGTLWLGTEYGLCHLDGEGCLLHPDPTWAVQGGIRALSVAPDGTVWLSSEGGVRRFDGTSWQSYPFYEPPHDLAATPGGEVWAAAPAGVARYLPDRDEWVSYTEEQGLPSSYAQVVAVAPDGEVWASIAWDGLYRLDGEEWHALGQAPGGQVADIVFAADGTPWVATVGGLHYPGGSLAYWDGQAWIDVSAGEGLISFQAVALGPDDRVAASTHLGLGIYQDGDWRLLKDGPASDRVTAVAITPDGAAWFAAGDESLSTEGTGLSRFDGEAWDYHLGDAEVGALAVAPDGSLWAGAGCSVQRFDGRAWQVVGRCEEDLPVGNVLDIAFSPDGAAWVATGLALARFDGDSWTVYDRLVHSVLAAPDGAIWASGWEGTQGSNYIARFDGENWTIYRSADSFPGSFSLGAVTPDGRLWGVAPGRGLASFDGGAWSEGSSWSFYSQPKGLPAGELSLLAAAPDGALWLGMEEGVARFDPLAPAGGAWTFHPADMGLGRGYTRALAFGPGGEVWFGATRFQPAP